MASQSNTNRLTHVFKREDFYQDIAYALPSVTIAFLVGPVATILQGIYAKYFGIPLATVAAVILMARLFDAISDPIIGYLSDRYQHHLAGRKLFIVSGGLLFIVSSYFLYAPLELSSQSTQVGNVSVPYFLGWFLAFYLSFTLFEIPHLAWGGEIAMSAHDRNKLYGLRALASYIGLLLFFVVPLLPFFESDEFTPQTLAWSVTAASIVMLPLLLICIFAVPKDRKAFDCDRQRQDFRKDRFSVIAVSIISNKPFLVFLAAFFFSGAALGMWYGMMYLFVDVYLGLGHKLSLAYVLSFGVTIPMLGFWVRLANKVDKSTSWGIGMVLVLVGIFGTGFLMPGESSWLPLLLCMVLISTGSAASVALAPSLLTDIIDYSALKFELNSAATYFSLYTLVAKGNVAIGGAAGLAIAASYGFDPLNIVQSAEAQFGLLLSIAWLPVLITLISISFIALTPINARRHRVIRRRLDGRTYRASRGSGNKQICTTA